MSVLGVIVRARPSSTDAVRAALEQLPGVDIALEAPDGRLILVIEDSGTCPAAAALAEVAAHPLVINTSLVYEYSGTDADRVDDGLDGYMAWRSGLNDLRRARSNEPL